ncbi:MAG: hypothetical protein ACFFD4_10870 [Candidatus Odinarchaeota archaeon]
MVNYEKETAIEKDSSNEQDVNIKLKKTLGKIIFGLDKQKHETTTIVDTQDFETVELMILNSAGLPVYRKTRKGSRQKKSPSLFAGVMAAIQKVINEELEFESTEPLVIQTGKLTTIIFPSIDFNVIVIGSGKHLADVKLQVSHICQVIYDSGIMTRLDGPVNVTAVKEEFLSLKSRMPVTFAEFFADE